MRFPEFDGEWKVAFLGDVSFYVNARIPTEKMDPKSYISTENMRQNYSGIAEASSIPIKSSVIAYNPGDVLISNIRPYLKKSWLATYSGGCSSDVLVVRSKTCLPKFLFYILSSDKFINYVMNGAKGVKMPRGDKKQIMKYEFHIPSMTEQNKITDLLSLIDKRIEIQNAIIDDLKKLRSSVIDNILSCNHNKNLMQPTVKKRLKDIGEYIRGLTYSIDEVSTNGKGIVVMRANNIDDGEPLNYKTGVITVDKNINTKQLLRKGDVVICMANGSSQLVGKNSVYDGESRVPITVGAFCGIFRSDYLLSQWITQTRKYRRHIYQAIQGGNGAIANIIGEDILDVPFIMPSNRQEPIILSLLISIDNKINNEIAILEKQKEKKLFLLNNMFI